MNNIYTEDQALTESELNALIKEADNWADVMKKASEALMEMDEHGAAQGNLDVMITLNNCANVMRYFLQNSPDKLRKETKW